MKNWFFVKEYILILVPRGRGAPASTFLCALCIAIADTIQARIRMRLHYSRLPHNPSPILLDKSHKFEQAENFVFGYGESTVCPQSEKKRGAEEAKLK